MSIFVTNYNTNQPELLPHLSRNCVCCLAVNVTFVQLEKCLHKQFLIEYFKNEINFKCSVICLKCHNFLLKIEKFKQLITRSIICSVKHTKKEPNNPISLKRTAIQILSIIPIYLDNVNHTLLRNKKGIKQDPWYRVQEIHQEPTDNNTRTSEDTRDVSEDGSKDFSVDFDIKTDVCSDDEVNHKECTDVKVEPSVAERKTSETESENELTDYMKNPYSFSAPPDPNCYNGRIKILSLTPEQVLAERETLRRHPNYVNKNFKCDLCIKGFIHKNALDSHMKRHDEKHGPALCPICKSYQKTDVILKNHYKRHFTRYECVICGLRFMCETSCGGHYNSAHGKKHGVLAFDHRCNKCDYVTDCYRNLTHHKRTHRKISRECNECYRIFTTDTGYANHIRNCHTGEKQVYSCKLCNKMCKSSSSFNYHMTSKHIWESGRASKTYCCAECKTVYSSKQGLVAHLSTHSKHAKKGEAKVSETYCCAECKTVYSSKQGLVAHLTTHSKHAKKGEAKLICHDCGAKFHNKPEIKRHIHLNHMRINKCPVCSKIYSTSSGLRTHTERAHLGKEAPRDKICQYCGKGFTTNVTLKVHIRTHTLERPLKCPQCPATFAHPAARYNHKKLVHNPNRVRKARQTQKFVDGVDNK